MQWSSFTERCFERGAFPKAQRGIRDRIGVLVTTLFPGIHSLDAMVFRTTSSYGGVLLQRAADDGSCGLLCKEATMVVF